MKNKFVLGLACFVFIHNVNAQFEEFPNGNFETWPSISDEVLPEYWIGQSQMVMPYFWYTTDAHSGQYAVQLTGEVTEIEGEYFLDYSDMTMATSASSFHETNDALPYDHINEVYPGFGVNFTSRPDSVVGWCKYHNPEALPGQEFMFLVVLTKWNSATNTTEKIGEAKLFHPPTEDNYVRFSVPVDYLSSETPDTLRARLTAIQFHYYDEHPASWLADESGILTLVPITLYIDDLAFIYNEEASIEENDNNSLKLYPNPASNTLNFSSDEFEIIDYKLQDLSGKEIQTGTLTKNQTLDVTNYFNGVYLLHFYNEGSFIGSRKITIQH